MAKLKEKYLNNTEYTEEELEEIYEAYMESKIDEEAYHERSMPLL